MPPAPFTLSILGGNLERLYRAARPEIEAMPWGTVDTSAFTAAELRAACRCWMESAFLEHRTAAACADVLRALVVARAPIDLVALASRFPLDELVHVELCVRFCNELGQAVPLIHDPERLVPRVTRASTPLAEAAELVLRCFCIGEALSVPLLRETWRQTEHPLPRAILGRIVKDEAAHGELGWMFFDWAADQVDDETRAHLRRCATDTIADWRASWDRVAHYEASSRGVGRQLGWIDPTQYVALARRVLESDVVAPLAARGLAPVDA